MPKQHKKYTGLLLKESLKDEDVLDMLQISRVEKWHVENAADFQPDIWTAIYFEGDENKVDKIAHRLSQSIKSDGRWYINVSTKDDVYVIFLNKVFRYIRGDEKVRAEAIKYGQSLGIPERQLDWGN